MTTSSEEILMQVEKVKYKKSDGTLYVMSERLAWILDEKDTVSLSHNYADIKTQKISPEGKPKIQLQVVMHDGSSSTFHFVNPDGQEAQIRDRNLIKELLQQLLPKFQKKVNKELEEKNRLLQENPTLLQLYKDLVITGVITSEEFWAQHATQYTEASKAPRQEIGVNSAFLADIKPQTDGCNGLKYNLTIDIINCIFKTYPAVKKKHQENVPAKMTESEFWTKFFQSHYFHRDRMNQGTKDIFTECAKIDDQEMKKDVQAGVNDPMVDITGFDDINMEEIYVDTNKPEKSTGNIVHQNMIKRFNQHSIMVMKANIAKQTENEKPHTNGSTSPKKANNNNADSHNSSPQAKKRRIQEKLVYEDLESNLETQRNEEPLVLEHVDRYLHGPVSNVENITDMEHLKSAAAFMVRETERWSRENFLPRQPSSSLVYPPAAVAALGELTPGGYLMKGFREDSLSQMIPHELERDLASVYVCTCELLKHFWRAFPATTPQLEEKVIRMHTALRNFHNVKLMPFEDRLQREYSVVSQHLTAHLNQLLNAAYRKYIVFQNRKTERSR
ncbi:general transcription factor IIH subunit 1 [Trichogramma pretiosum]|uniref:general transcription factor IIH subunit 1 n=1 Tax=Trichogramma pretiosum TaxID=7493 RepID=UPI0006C953CB|nr:general transcription factor IIH subunit 1 [Trichogramma pretiosum]